MTRAALSYHSSAVKTVFGLGPDDRVLQFAAPGFDVAAEEIFPTLISGACVVVIPDERRTPADLEKFLSEENVTVANIPASYWQEWVADLDADPRPLPASLRLLVVGSDAVYTRTLARWRRHSGVPVINAYGLTETTITSVLATYTADAEIPRGERLPIGKPLPGVEAQVLDAELRPVPVGVPGELFLGGPGLARGYHNRPQDTAERFVYPLPDRPEARFYRTGDLVVSDADGVLTCLGRVDDQVKIRGHRVEPSEVTGALLTCAGVRQAHVRAVPGDEGTRLIGYVVPEYPASAGGATRRDGAALRAELAETLPSAMIPGDFVFLDALPVTVNGKIDAAALPLPADVTTPPSGDPDPFSRPAQRLVARVWSEVLGAPVVGLDDNFFDLGGHSLLLARVRRMLGETLGRPVPGVALFEHTTVRTLAAFLDDGGREAGRESGPGGAEHGRATDADGAGDRGEQRRSLRARQTQRAAAQHPRDTTAATAATA
ncbi:non-ribosomal peptide synthetase, partial [Streptomyces sp. NPDC004610]